MEPKQVIVIRKDLGMRKGKIAAQVAHASMEAILNFGDWADYNCYELQNIPRSMVDWLNGTFTKVVVSCGSEGELLDIYRRAKEKEIPCSLVQDNGYTEFHGVKTYTAVAVGPESSEVVNEITGELNLL